MPPKKKLEVDTTVATTGEAGEVKFGWTTENDRALLVLCFGRNPSTEDYQNFADALPAGASYNGVKIRCSKLRIEMRTRYQQLGWEIPEPVSTKALNKLKTKTEKPSFTNNTPDTALKPKAPMKRKTRATGDDDAEGEEEMRSKTTAAKTTVAKKRKNTTDTDGDVDETASGDGEGGKDDNAPENKKTTAKKRKHTASPDADVDGDADADADADSKSTEKSKAKATRSRAKKGGVKEEEGDED